jgi:hypothetical protein
MFFNEIYVVLLMAAYVVSQCSYGSIVKRAGAMAHGIKSLFGQSFKKGNRCPSYRLVFFKDAVQVPAICLRMNCVTILVKANEM